MIVFRDADAADLPDIVRLLADDRFGAGRERFEAPLPPGYRRGFDAMQAQGGRVILAVLDGAVIGCLQLHVLYGVSQVGQTAGQIEGVRVDSARRGHGIGQALMRHAIAQARAAGCTAMRLTSRRERVEAQGFYERLGFVMSHVGMKLTIPEG